MGFCLNVEVLDFWESTIFFSVVLYFTYSVHITNNKVIYLLVRNNKKHFHYYFSWGTFGKWFISRSCETEFSSNWSCCAEIQKDLWRQRCKYTVDMSDNYRYIFCYFSTYWQKLHKNMSNDVTIFHDSSLNVKSYCQ